MSSGVAQENFALLTKELEEAEAYGLELGATAASEPGFGLRFSRPSVLVRVPGLQQPATPYDETDFTHSGLPTCLGHPKT